MIWLWTYDYISARNRFLWVQTVCYPRIISPKQLIIDQILVNMEHIPFSKPDPDQ